MRTHEPKYADTIRGLRARRKLRGMLDAQAAHNADISEGEIVSPFGRGFFNVKVPGNASPFIVADQTGGRSFAPGSRVLLASVHGRPGQAVIGGAPAGRKGGTATTTNRRRRGSSAADAAAANQYAFGNDGTNSVAMLYQDGTFVSTRLTVASFGGAYVGCILTDQSLLVGDGSALMSDGALGSGVQVWDVEGGVAYSYSSPSGWLLASNPYYHGGLVYILEVEDGSAITGHLTANVQFRLRSTFTDLTNATTLSTFSTTATDYDLGNGTNHYDGDGEYFSAGGLMVNDSHAVVYLKTVAVNANHEVAVTQHYQFQITLAGGSESHRDYIADTYDLVATLDATLADGSFLAGGGTVVLAKADDASSEAAVLVSGMTGSTLSINVAPDGVTYQTFNSGPGIWRGGALITSAIDAFDETPNYPSTMFYSGV